MGQPHRSRNQHLIVILVQKSALKRSVKTRNAPSASGLFGIFHMPLFNKRPLQSLSLSLPLPAVTSAAISLVLSWSLLGCFTLQIITELRTPGPSRLAALRRSRTLHSITSVSSAQTRVSSSQPRAYLPQSPPYQPICLEDLFKAVSSSPKCLIRERSQDLIFIHSHIRQLFLERLLCVKQYTGWRRERIHEGKTSNKHSSHLHPWGVPNSLTVPRGNDDLLS